MDTREKILQREQLAARIAEHRARGKRVVLANGCFDLLHAGHVRYLDGARRQGDVLVVAVNSDASARPLKGPGRPILAAEARARLVAALGAVSYVTVFDEPDVVGAAHGAAAGRARQGHRLHRGHRAGARDGAAARCACRHRRRSQAPFDHAADVALAQPSECLRWVNKVF